MKAPEWPAEEINLAWRQKLAAYWAISWPALLVSYIAAGLVTAGYTLDDLVRHTLLVGVVGNLAFFGTQAILTRRLVHKKYRTFRVGLFRNDGVRSSRLAMGEALRVWLFILGPQLALVLTASVFLWLWGAKMPDQAVRSVSSLSLWLRFLVVGPYAIDFALRIRYPGFRLQAFGYRYV